MSYVLVIDDDPDVREYIVGDLRARGREAEGVEDFEAALLMCTRARPALVVIDMIVETAESHALLRRLDSCAPGLRVIVLRCDAGPAVAFHALDVTIIAGEGWFEQLPRAVDRHLLH
jgi:two-component system KDP operon response regulator KdpE